MTAEAFSEHSRTEFSMHLNQMNQNLNEPKLKNAVAQKTTNQKDHSEDIQLRSSKNGQHENLLNYTLLILLIAISIITYPTDIWDAKVTVTYQHVWYYGWITAVSTGVGVLPFFLISEPDKYWIGVSNALAAGMMVAASYSLAYEGSTSAEVDFGYLSWLQVGQGYQALVRTLLGFLAGMLFIIITKAILDRFGDLKAGDIEGIDVQKMILIVFVMTLHSLSEGIGIGVSFGGNSGMQLGQFISLSLAMHNVPEGLAVALVMTTRKVSTFRTVLWAVFTSLPQPLTAIPAFLFVERFIPLLPVGLGFAAGAMTYVALFELLAEAVEETSIPVTAVVSTVACCVMFTIQNAVKLSL